MSAGAAKIIQLNGGFPGLDEARGAIGVAEGLGAQYVICIPRDLGILHVVQKDSLAFDSELNVARSMTEDPDRFLREPLEVIFGPDQNNERQRYKYAGAAGEHKRVILDSLEAFLNRLPGTKTISEQALLIADEIYTNGIKNAWDPKKGLFVGEPVNPGTVEFFAEADKERLAIGCIDSYGKLDTHSLVTRIAACYEMGVADAIRHGKGGAGIGSYMVYDAALSYYAGAIAGKKSLVCITLPLGMSRRRAADLKKNIHILGGTK